MIFNVGDNARAQAKAPHNLFMLNLALFHLLMTPAIIATGVGELGILLPLALSLAVIAYTWRRANGGHNQAFVCAHWQLAMRRYRLLLIAYAVTAVLLLLGWLLTQGTSDPNMRDILQTVLLRIAVMPVVLMVMVNFYLESSALFQATNGEVPDSALRHCPSHDIPPLSG
ncbi:MAG TPA: hypothetical protein ENJ17_05445 [Gammaproteobacteria bacterium]|nr:hypothetical protein [Gammaproteobacteria bacterium]